MVYIGYHEPQESAAVANTTNVNAINQNDRTSVDNVVATSVASNVAKTVNLPIATSVANLAVSAQTKSEFTQSDGTSTIKPQIIESSISNRAVINYKVKAGDTVTSLAKKYKVSDQTIKWANNLTTDALPVNKVLKILPFDGVLYSVKSGDTIESIAKKYGVNKTRLVTNNDLEESGLKLNTSIILPSATLPEEERPGYVAPAPVIAYNYYSNYGTGFGGGQTWNIGYGDNSNYPYAWGNCTMYAYNRRVQLGLRVEGNWGNADTWAGNAARAGFIVNNKPSVHAIMQNRGGWGHVAIVESILPNGDLSISEMNASVPGGGRNVISGRIVPVGNISFYSYIH